MSQIRPSCAGGFIYSHSYIDTDAEVQIQPSAFTGEWLILIRLLDPIPLGFLTLGCCQGLLYCMQMESDKHYITKL